MEVFRSVGEIYNSKSRVDTRLGLGEKIECFAVAWRFTSLAHRTNTIYLRPTSFLLGTGTALFSVAVLQVLN